jgi:SPP1 family predicted phage head-tail adaptor
MQASHLYEQLSIQQKSVTRDADFGSEIVTWVDLYTDIRANTSEKSGFESVRDGQRVMTRRIEVLFRWRSGITTDMRVKHHDGRIFQIMEILEIPRKRALLMMCEEYSV